MNVPLQMEDVPKIATIMLVGFLVHADKGTVKLVTPVLMLMSVKEVMVAAAMVVKIQMVGFPVIVLEDLNLI